MDRSGTVDVAVCRVGTTSSVSVDPLQPMFGTMASDQVLKVIRSGDALGLRGTQEVLLDGVGVIAKADFDWALESMKLPVIARALNITINEMNFSIKRG